VDSFLAMNKKKTVLTIFFVFLILFLISLLIKIPQNKKNEDYVKVGILKFPFTTQFYLPLITLIKRILY
jgi:hypothetical protein